MSDSYNSMTVKQAVNLAAPHTWVASVTPAVFAVFYCWYNGYDLSLVKALLLVLACICLQSSVNTFNDYFDFVKGTDTSDDFLEVNDAVLIYSDINPKSARNLAFGFLAAGIILGLICCIGSGFVPIMIGIIGALIIVTYSGGPIPVSYLPIGEMISGFVMGGLIPLGIAACTDGGVHGMILVYALPLIIGIGLIMMSNNGSDIEKDIKAKRYTFPTRIGREKTRRIYRSSIVIWLVFASILPIAGCGYIGLVTVMLITIIGRKCIASQMVCTLEPENRISTMKGIAKLNMMLNGAYVLAFVAACILEVAVHGRLF